eukprot:1160745-Pelagomonas_calceolata.AAC.20
MSLGKLLQRKNNVRRGYLSIPTSIKENEARSLKRAGSPLHHKTGTERASGDLEVCIADYFSGCWWDLNNEHTNNQFKISGPNHQGASKLARVLRARFVRYAHKLTNVIGKKHTSHSLEPGASSNPPDPHWPFFSHGTTQRTSAANSVKQLRHLIANQQRVHLIEIKHCGDTRPGQQLEAAKRQHAVLCKLISA